MSHTLSRLFYHVVFSTEGRRPLLNDELRPSVFAYMAGILSNIGGKALIINGMPDHVHILCRLPPNLDVAKAAQAIKANSSRWIHQERGMPRFAWQVGYSAFTVAASSVDGVYRYVERQEEHHRSQSYQGECEEFYRLAGIPEEEWRAWDEGKKVVT